MRKTIRQGQTIPAWYGIAWQNFDSRTAVCFPIPINVIVATGRAFWLWLRYGYKPVPLDPRDAFVQGHNEGYHSGLMKGKKAKCRGEQP